jgi:pilus assembly protein Flp/PilA
MQNLFTRFIEDESGATAIEYGLIAALIAVGMILGATAIGDQVNAKFDEVAGEVGSADNRNAAANVI